MSKIGFFLDDEFSHIGFFGSFQNLQKTARVLDAELLHVEDLLSFLMSSKDSVVVMCHGGHFPEEALDSFILFMQKGGDSIWLGGQPFEKEWIRNGDRWERGDPMDRGYPECPFERHKCLGISPWWTVPVSDLDPSEQCVTIFPHYRELFGNAASFRIKGQLCQLMPFGPGRRVVIGAVTHGASTFNRNDIISMVEPGLGTNKGGGRILCCGFNPAKECKAEFFTDLIRGLLNFLKKDVRHKLKAGMTLDRIAVPQGTPVTINISPRSGQNLQKVYARIQNVDSIVNITKQVKGNSFSISTGEFIPGRYKVQLLEGEKDLGLSEWFSVIKSKEDEPFLKAEVEYAGKYAAFRINGKLCPMQTYSGHASHRTFGTIIQGFRDAGIHIYHIIENIEWGWKGPSQFDWSRHDYLRERILREDPEAFLFPRVGLCPPQWWIESHPESMWHHETAKTTEKCSPLNAKLASYYDPVWRQDTIEAMTSLIRHSCESWYGNRFLGIHYAYGHAGEWGEIPKDGVFWADLHPAFVNWFREWLKQKYGTDEKMRESWDQTKHVGAKDLHINNSQHFRSTNCQHHLLDDQETNLHKARQVGPSKLKEALIPNFFRRRIGKHGIIRDPRQVRDVIDFLECYQTGFCLLHRDLSKAFKEAGSRRILIGRFGGYYLSGPYEVDGGYTETPYPQLLDAVKDLDILSTPNFYYNAENPTGDAVCKAAHESYRLHGKLLLQENDQRTCLTKIKSTKYGTPEGNIEETLGSMKRNWVIRTSRGAGLWWFDFAQGFYDHPEIISLLRKLQEIYIELIKRPNPKSFDKELARIAMFYSPMSHLYIVSCSNYLRRVAENHVQRHFNRYGIPWELYFPEDAEHVPCRRVYLFLNTNYLTKEQRRIIDTRFKRNGNILIWLYAPGIIDEDGFDIKKASDLTGFTLESVSEWRKLRIEIINHSHPIAQAIEGYDISDFGTVVSDDMNTSPEMDKVCPQIFVSPKDHAVVPIGKLEATDRIGFAVKDFGSWKSIYVSTAILPAAVMRGILSWAGIETHTDTLDNFYTNGDLVGLNSLESGYKTIRFPGEFKLKDLMTGHVYTSQNREVKVWVRYRDTFLGQISSYEML